MKWIELFAKQIWKTGKFPVTFGGDHGITYPIVKALGYVIQGKVGITHLDGGHGDRFPVPKMSVF